MKVEVEIGDPQEIVAMTANAAATHVRGLVERFEENVVLMIDSLRAEQQRTSAVPLRSMTTTPSCEGCGTAVAPGQRYCDTCAEKPQFQPPPAGRDFGSHPRPAYRDVPAGQVER